MGLRGVENCLHEVEKQKGFILEAAQDVAAFMKTRVYQKYGQHFFNQLDWKRVQYEEQQKLNALRVELCKERGE